MAEVENYKVALKTRTDQVDTLTKQLITMESTKRTVTIHEERITSLTTQLEVYQ